MLDWQSQAPHSYHEPTPRDECKYWLEDFLKANPEGIAPKDVEKAGLEEGFSRPMIFRARKELGEFIQNTVGHKTPGNRWKWVEAG
jgi:hypothetical protein